MNMHDKIKSIKIFFFIILNIKMCVYEYEYTLHIYNTKTKNYAF